MYIDSKVYSFINTVLKLEEEYWWKIKINIKINKYKPAILITCNYAQAQLKFLQINETFTKTPKKIPAYTVQNIMLGLASYKVKNHTHYGNNTPNRPFTRTLIFIYLFAHHFLNLLQ